MASDAAIDEELTGGVLAQNESAFELDAMKDSAMQQVLEAVAEDQADEIDIRSLVYGAGELKAQEMMLPQLLQQHLADQMTFEDLPEDLQTQVRRVQERSHPKFNPASAAAMVGAGMAFVYERYLDECVSAGAIRGSGETAQDMWVWVWGKVGLEKPWDWRKVRRWGAPILLLTSMAK